MTPAAPSHFVRGLATEDWWAVAIGLLLVAIGAFAFHAGLGLERFAVIPQAWTSLADLRDQFAGSISNYFVLGGLLLMLFTAAASALGFQPIRYAIGFIILLTLSLLTLVIAAWMPVREIGLEPPVIALCLGVILGNAGALPPWLTEGLRAELYVKTGVVLVGATLPLPLLWLAGPIAIFQASLIALVTFMTIYGVGRFLGVNRRLSAMLAAGGSVCGVSATIAVAGAVRAQREDVSIAASMVIAWSMGMVFLLPLLAHAWYLPAGPAGAWIGSSAYADAAGFAAVQVYDGYLRGGVLAGSGHQAMWAFTLVKVIGRDMWIGVWAVGISVYALWHWETDEGRRLQPWQIWHRFPKFIIGFVIASILVTWADHSVSAADFDSIVRPGLIRPLDALRDVTFTLGFLSIGTSMRLRNLVPVGGNAFLAFAAGAVVNLVLGYILSAVFFLTYWNGLGR